MFSELAVKFMRILFFGNAIDLLLIYWCYTYTQSGKSVHRLFETQITMGRRAFGKSDAINDHMFTNLLLTYWTIELGKSKHSADLKDRSYGEDSPYINHSSRSQWGRYKLPGLIY